MELSFVKMHGAGNDYVYVNCMDGEIARPEQVAQIVSDRHFGIGSDGLVLILPSERADFRMRMFNADGSEGKMCGNASRCIAKYVYDHHLTEKKEISLETLSGIKTLTLETSGNRVVNVTVNMGKAVLTPSSIPVAADQETPFINQPVETGGEKSYVTCVSMGNPHAVVFLDDIASLDLPKIGPIFENNPIFPDRINTEFVHAVDRQMLEMRVWERGSGETMACGTGACASVVAAILNGYCGYDEKITVRLLGGDLVITCKKDLTVLMSGPAVHVFDGTMHIDL